MADQLKVGLINYAVCAAMSGQDSHLFRDAGLLGQIDKFESDLKGEKADSGALYFIQIGIIDIILLPYTYEYKSDVVIANIVTAVTRLAKLGAKHVMVGNSLDLNNFPGFKREGVANEAEKFYTSMNTSLPGEMEKLAQELNIQVEVFDLATVAEHIQNNPDKYGLTQLESTCTDLPYSSDSVCKNPDEYYYWGYYYLSRVVHNAMGEAMAEQVSK
jgi:phospholipase/lecithinase/hemolysin